MRILARQRAAQRAGRRAGRRFLALMGIVTIVFVVLVAVHYLLGWW
jgi:hypothetical protein